MTRKIIHRKNYFKSIEKHRAQQEEERLIQEALAARAQGRTTYWTKSHKLYEQYRAKKNQQERERKAATKYRMEKQEKAIKQKLEDATAKEMKPASLIKDAVEKYKVWIGEEEKTNRAAREAYVAKTKASEERLKEINNRLKVLEEEEEERKKSMKDAKKRDKERRRHREEKDKRHRKRKMEEIYQKMEKRNEQKKVEEMKAHYSHAFAIATDVSRQVVADLVIGKQVSS